MVGGVTSTDAPSARDVLFRPMEDADAPRINALFTDEYGPSYPYKLADAQGPGVLTVAEVSGEVVAFARAVPLPGANRAFEFGGLIVRPDFRRQHIATSLTNLRLAAVLERGGALAVSEPVCYRADCASQINLLRRGFRLAGILPFKYPDIHRDLLGDQPESMVLAVRSLTPGKNTGFGHRHLCVPDVVRELIHLYLPAHILARSWDERVPGPMPPSVDHDGYAGSVTTGSRFVDVPANWSSSREVIYAYLAVGYRFAAVLPGFNVTEDGHVYDSVRLYRPPEDVSLAMELVHVAEPLRPLHAVMARDLHTC